MPLPALSITQPAEGRPRLEKVTGTRGARTLLTVTVRATTSLEKYAKEERQLHLRAQGSGGTCSITKGISVDLLGGKYGSKVTMLPIEAAKGSPLCF